MTKKNLLISCLLSLFVLCLGCGNDEPTADQSVPTIQPPPASESEAEALMDTTEETGDPMTEETEIAETPVPPPAPASTTPDISSFPANDDPGAFRGTVGISERLTPDAPVATLQSIRTGHHPGYDRLVLDFEGSTAPGYYVEYVDRPVYECSTMDTVTVAGNGRLLVRIDPAQAHSEGVPSTLEQTELNFNFTYLKEAKLTCDLEGQVTWLLGVSGKQPYRALALNNPPRLVVDIIN